MSKQRLSYLAALFLGLVVCLAGGAQAADQAGSDVPSLETGGRYFDGRHWRQLWLNPHEVADLEQDTLSEELIRRSAPNARAVTHGRGVRIWQLGKDKRIDGMKRGLTRSESRRFAPVYHLSPRGGARVVMAGNMVVRFREEMTRDQLRAWAAEQGVRFVRAMAQPRIYIFAAESPEVALSIANQLQQSGSVEYAMPEFWNEAHIR